MATTVTTTCDICGKQKQITNHWYKLDLSKSFCLSLAGDIRGTGYDDICGAECATKALNQWMQDQTNLRSKEDGKHSTA